MFLTKDVNSDQNFLQVCAKFSKSVPNSGDAFEIWSNFKMCIFLGFANMKSSLIL